MKKVNYFRKKQRILKREDKKTCMMHLNVVK